MAQRSCRSLPLWDLSIPSTGQARGIARPGFFPSTSSRTHFHHHQQSNGRRELETLLGGPAACLLPVGAHLPRQWLRPPPVAIVGQRTAIANQFARREHPVRFSNEIVESLQKNTFVRRIPPKAICRKVVLMTEPDQLCSNKATRTSVPGTPDHRTPETTRPRSAKLFQIQRDAFGGRITTQRTLSSRENFRCNL